VICQVMAIHKRNVAAETLCNVPGRGPRSVGPYSQQAVRSEYVALAQLTVMRKAVCMVYWDMVDHLTPRVSQKKKAYCGQKCATSCGNV